jgi:hypothetical protein
MPELGLLQIDDLATMALGAAVLPHHPADKAFRSPVTLPQNLDGSVSVAPRGELCSVTTLRAQKFPSARSLSIAFSSSVSARSFHSFREAFG